MLNIKIIKKDGTRVSYNPEKIVNAIAKSAARVMITLTDKDNDIIIDNVENYINNCNCSEVSIAVMHNIVETALDKINPLVAKSYKEYRNYKIDFVNMLDEVYNKAQSIMYIGDKDNANSDSSLTSTQQSLIRGELTKMLYDKFYMNEEERQACRDGYIYIHDKKDRMFTTNCCICNIGNILKGGFESCNLSYTEPKSVDVALSVIGDIMLMASSQQYGGFSVRLDDVLPYYCEKSFVKYENEFLKIALDCYVKSSDELIETAKQYAISKTRRDLEQGIQGLEMKFNSMASSRGDFSFLTVGIGLDTSFWGKEVSKAFLKVRMKGQGKPGFKKPVLFPKLVFLYTEKLHGEGKELEDVFNLAVECSSKAQYPDFVSLDAGFLGEVYNKWEKPIVPMGCRSYVSAWYPLGGTKPINDKDVPVFEGRFNFGVISLNLPMIYQKAKLEGKDFYKVLDYYMDLTRKHHLKTFNMLSRKKASINPLMFCEGGLYGGNLKPSDEILPVLKHATCSIGYTALNELNLLHTGKTLVENSDFALEVLKYIYNETERFKHEDGVLFGVYGTPAESLISLQVKQFKSKFGEIKGVTDKPYFTNSFHCWVGENITPIQKQDIESKFWKYSPGGRIQYVRYNIDYNIKAIKSLVRRAMQLGFYEGVNLALSYCDDCGHKELDMEICPKCGSSNLTKIDRVCGYLGYTKIKGSSRLNDGKLSEIKDRISC